MPELRIDPLSGARAIIATERATRPGGEPRYAPAPNIDPLGDPFAAGNEDRTPPELYALRPNGGESDGGGWQVRVVPNLYPALEPVAGEGVSQDGAPARSGAHTAHLDLFMATRASGAHEVIINSPACVGSLSELAPEAVGLAMGVWRERMREHSASAYVQLIVNERVEAGASLPHTHAQLYALDFVPAELARERERFSAYATRTMGQNLLADVLAEEVRTGERIVSLDEEGVVLAPYASRVPFQLMIVPRQARARFEQDGALCARLLHDVLCRLARLLGSSPPLNLFIRNAPSGAEHFCWHIEILPRLTHLAGLELATGVHLNIVGPERAAALLREA